MIIFIIYALMQLAINAPGSITGRWETHQVNESILCMVFKPDNHFEGYINKKPFVSGTYTFQNDTIYMDGNGCINMPGKYKIYFLGNADSIRWELSATVVKQEEKD